MKKLKHQETKRTVDGAKKAVLMIHGIIGTPDHFAPLLPAIPESVSLYNLLLDGHGKGVREFSHTSMKKWEQQVEAAVKELAASHEEIYVVAHSMGTLLALEQAIQCPKITKLFLLAVPLRLFLTPRLFSTLFRVYFDKIPPDDLACLAARDCCGVTHSKNPFLYFGWVPRYLELFAKICATRRLIDRVNIPCTVYQSKYDEMVSKKALRYLQALPDAEISILEDSRHFYYGEQDVPRLLRALKDFIGE